MGKKRAVTDFVAAQFEYVRGWARMAGRGVSEDLLVTVPAGAGSHILWELGHIVWAESYLITWGCANGDPPSGEWNESFGYRSRPSEGRQGGPGPGEVRDALGNGSERTGSYIRSLTEEDLKSPPVNLPADHFPDTSSVFIHLLSHEAYHVGKASQLRKMLGLPSVAEVLLEGGADR